MNCVILVGRLVNDAVFSQSPDGSVRCNYTMAVDRITKRTQGKNMTADFFDCTAFGNAAKAAMGYQNQYNGYRKGDIISLTGRGEFDVYQDRRTGQTNRRYQVIVNEHSCVYRMNSSSTQNANGQAYSPQEYQAPVYQAPAYDGAPAYNGTPAYNNTGYTGAQMTPPQRNHGGYGAPATGSMPANNGNGYPAGQGYTR